MKNETRAPALFFAPFVSSSMRVEPQWIDYNGHLNMAYYHVLFDRAVDEVFSLVGLTRDYAETRHASTFTAECHVLYKRELTEGDLVRITAQIIAFDDKRLHYYLSLHVDMIHRKVMPFPPDILANLALMKAAHGRMPLPAAVGRIIGMPERRAIAVEDRATEPEAETRH
jgi:acyl-CoA thioester hydrolase